jgi:hypothetical protein
MRIVPIFAAKLFSFHYEHESQNELDRLLDNWTDTEYLFDFIEENRQDVGILSSSAFVERIMEDADRIEDTLLNLCENPNSNLDAFFKPLHNQEYQLLPIAKRKGRENLLRIYALRIDSDCYVITGGAIKLTHLMEDREHTVKELAKLDASRRFLSENGVFDSESFYEFLYETR